VAKPIADATSLVEKRAIEVIGSQQQAMRWLGTPVRALGYATPISLLYDDQGTKAVLDVLGRLEHGVL
jgi:putative toxin-antitoxin system antitoxin component (TIGR02293 family)